MSKINYNNRVFTAILNSDNGEVSNRTQFHYFQKENMVWANYQGGEIIKGHLIGTADSNGKLDFAYHHMNTYGTIMTGKCHSVPQILEDGRIRLQEEWQWTSGDGSKGSSIVEEVK